MIVELNSVGCVMDTKEMLVFAQMENGTFDIDNPVHIDDVSEEWMSTLSHEDFVKVGMVIGIFDVEV